MTTAVYKVYDTVYNRTMKTKKYSVVLEKQFNETYHTPVELEYSASVGTFLSPFEYSQLLDYQDSILTQDTVHYYCLPLDVFNHRHLFYSKGTDLSSLLSAYIQLTASYPEIADRFSSSFITSRIYSEIEGTLNVENVPTTRRRLRELLEENAPEKDINDTIIKNMKAGIDFVNQLPTFNKENLFTLYNILTRGCLKEENKLIPGNYYRHDTVEIGKYHGCPFNMIDKCLESLFDYVKDIFTRKDSDELLLLPHIAHYYILYIHPYFDYNGRTARMVSYWLFLLSGLKSFPPIISEAVNQTKEKYYQSIELTRDTHNDLTYFLKYILNLSIDYVLCYQNLQHFEQIAKNQGNILTETELNYLKRIMIAYTGVFTYADFLKMANVTMSKQGALKQLNKFINCGFLKEVPSSSKTKLFDLNMASIPYVLRNFGWQ